MSYEAILYETRGPVAIITLNGPERLNAIGAAVREEVHQAIETAHQDDTVRAAIITGAGKGFCSGADLSGAAARAAVGGGAPTPASHSERLDEDGWVGRWAKRFAHFDKPLIGAINGVAAGAGMSMALACDVRVGSTNARFKSVFIERNLSPDSGMTYFLPRIVGYSRAADLIFSSRAVNAEEAYRIGLLDRLVAPEALLDEVAGMVEWPTPLLGDMDPDFLSLPPEVIRTTMRTHQRYFAVRRAGDSQALAPHFVAVANIEASDGGALIAAGNARVLTARLEDARFFWEIGRAHV